jgi:23S rRNA pseudouridine2605 synthase
MTKNNKDRNSGSGKNFSNKKKNFSKSSPSSKSGNTSKKFSKPDADRTGKSKDGKFSKIKAKSTSKFDSDSTSFEGKKSFKKGFSKGTDKGKKEGSRSFNSKFDKTDSRKKFGKEEKSSFKPFSKEKPSEANRRKVFKKLNATEDIKYSVPPTYNLTPPKTSKKSEVPKKESGDDGKVRLNKFISNSGVCSRRDADMLIQMGEVSVNGKVITELGYKVEKTDVVKYNGQTLRSERPIYVLLNKPKDFITTTEDPEERQTVMALVKTACKERIYPVGRLDRQTTGLLLLTNDGELAKKLTHPSHKILKVYQADLDKPITQEDFEKISSGLELEDGPVKVDSIAVVSPDKKSIGLEIHEGRNRIVRRMFEHLGYEVVKLDRVMYAGLTKKDLPRGKWRYLSEKEVIRLKYFI